MATSEDIPFSGSTDGLGIKVAATSTPGTLIHTAHATSADLLEVYAYNSDTADRELTLEWGGTTSPDHHIKQTIPAKDGLHLVVPGLLLTNSKVLRAFAATANVIIILGKVLRVTP